MSRIGSFKDLIAWQKSMELVTAVYRLTSRFPAQERFGLVSQARRAAVSAPCNISEGYARRSLGDYVRFIDIARGSVNELETQLLIAERLKMAVSSDLVPVLELVHEVQRICKGLVDALERKESPKSSAGA